MKTDYCIYGFGETGKQVADLLIDNNQNVVAIFDRNPKFFEYRGINIFKLHNWKKPVEITNIICILAIHNHYISHKHIYLDLKYFGFGKIWNLVEFCKVWPFPDKYWLSSSFSYNTRRTQLEYLLHFFADKLSQKILLGVWDYWQNGILDSCPDPSLHDEYTPIDVPRYPKNLRFIDCGASNGSTLTRLSKADYIIEYAIAFEPDPINFKKLITKTKDYNLIPLPLGVWSCEKQLHFSANVDNSLASGIDSGGQLLIQCVSLDNIASKFAPNLIKFDIEGSELEALYGAKKLIQKYRPNLCISVYHRPGDPLDILALLVSWNLDYKFYLRCHEYNTFGLVLYCINVNDEIKDYN